MAVSQHTFEELRTGALEELDPRSRTCSAGSSSGSGTRSS